MIESFMSDILRFPGPVAAVILTLCHCSISRGGIPPEWRYENAFPTGAHLHAGWAAAENDVFFGGESGVILRWDGEHWNEMQTPTQKTINAIHGTGPSDVWAVGGDYHTVDDAEKSLILHFDGTTWSEVTPPEYAGSQFHFADVCAVAPDDVWAVSVAGAWIAHWDGSTWQFVTDAQLWSLGLEGNFYSIASAGADDIYFSGSHGQIVHYDKGAWELERKTESGSFSVNLNLEIWALNADNVYVGDNYGEVYKRNSADGSWISLDFADNKNIRGIWGRSATEIYLVSGDSVRVFDGSGAAPTTVSFQGAVRGGWNAASGAGDQLFLAGQFGSVHELAIAPQAQLTLSPLAVGGGSALTLPKNRESRLTGASPVGTSGGFFIYGDTSSRDGAHAIYRFDGSEFHSSPFGNSTPERMLDPGVWVTAVEDLKQHGTLIAFEGFFSSPLAGGVHWQRPLSGWVEVKGIGESRLRGIGALWEAPDSTDPDSTVVYALEGYEFNRSYRIFRIQLPHSEESPPTWELAYTLPAEVPASVSLTCLWGRSADEIYFGTTAGGVFHWDGSTAVAEMSPETGDAILAICGDAEGHVYAIGENGLAMHRSTAGSWEAFGEVEARAGDHFTGLVPAPDSMSCYATQTTNPGITGGGLGRIWKLDGTTATLEVRGLSGAPEHLVRTENAITGRNDLYAIGEQGIMVTTKPLPDSFSLERVSLASEWTSTGLAGVSFRIPNGQSLNPTAPMIATWREEQSVESFFDQAWSGNWVPLSSQRWVIRQDETQTGYTPLPPLDVQFEINEEPSLLNALSGSLRLLRNEGNGWQGFYARSNPASGVLYASSVSGFSTWAAAFALELEIEALADGQVRLSWPALADQHILERSDDLAAEDAWQPVEAEAQINAQRAEVILTRAQAREFFRLRR